MPYAETPELDVRYAVFGRGEPVTVFGHGVASSPEDVRFLGSGLRGTKVFPSFRGHGGTGDPAGGWDYAGVARDLLAVAEETGATRAVGVSMGAGAVLRVLAERPDRFERCALLLPPARTPDRLAALVRHAQAVERGDDLESYLWAELPDDLRAMRGMRGVVRERAARQARPGVALMLRGLAASGPPVEDLGALAAVRASCLVVAQEDDETHPVEVAWEWAAALPGARLHVFARPWSLLRERAALRVLLGGFLDGAEGFG